MLACLLRLESSHGGYCASRAVTQMSRFPSLDSGRVRQYAVVPFGHVRGTVTAKALYVTDPQIQQRGKVHGRS